LLTSRQNTEDHAVETKGIYRRKGMFKKKNLGGVMTVGNEKTKIANNLSQTKEETLF